MTSTQVLTLPWLSTHRRRDTGAPGLPVLSPPLQAGEAVANAVDFGGFIAYWGTGNDGNGNATAGVPYAGQGFIDARVQAGSVASIAALRALPFAVLAAVLPTFGVDVKSYYAGGGGQGGGRFVWNATSTATDDGGSVINPTGNAGGGRFLRLLPLGFLTPEMFGVQGGTPDDSLPFQAALTAAGASAATRIIVVTQPVYTLATAGQITVPTNVALVSFAPYAGADGANLPQINFTGGGGFYAQQGAAFHGLRLSGPNTAAFALIEAKGQVGVYNCRLEGSPYGVRASRRIIVGYSSVSINGQMSPTAGLTNGTYTNIAYTGDATNNARVNVTVSGGRITSIVFSIADNCNLPCFMMGFASGALYAGSPAVTNAGEAFISPMGRSRFHEVWMVGIKSCALEIDGALDFSHMNNVHIWDPTGITSGSIAFRFGHVDGLGVIGCKIFAYDTGIMWAAPLKRNNSFASVVGLEMDYTNVGSGGYQQNIRKCFNVGSPLAITKISMNLLSNADHHIVATDFQLLNVIGCNFERPQNSGLFNVLIQPSAASKGVVLIGGNTSDGNGPFATLSGAVSGEIAANQWSPTYVTTGGSNGYVNASAVTTGTGLSVAPIRFGSFSGATDSNGRVAIPHAMGTPGPQAPRVDMNGTAGAAGYRAVVISVDATYINVQCLNAAGAALAASTAVTMYYSA